MSSKKHSKTNDQTDPDKKMDAERALFERKIPALVALIRSDERPLQGLAGLLDWRFRGAISVPIKKGFVTGKPGECVYLPVSLAGADYHLILAGAGPRSGSEVPAETLQALKNNLAALKLEGVGVSQSDFGEIKLKGPSVCVVA
jgi:hypothetical protein